jgi:hypothetical protein
MLSSSSFTSDISMKSTSLERKETHETMLVHVPEAESGIRFYTSLNGTLVGSTSSKHLYAIVCQENA